jgi:hypothetical protein
VAAVVIDTLACISSAHASRYGMSGELQVASSYGVEGHPCRSFDRVLGHFGSRGEIYVRSHEVRMLKKKSMYDLDRTFLD